MRWCQGVPDVAVLVTVPCLEKQQCMDAHNHAMAGYDSYEFTPRHGRHVVTASFGFYGARWMVTLATGPRQS